MHDLHKGCVEAFRYGETVTVQALPCQDEVR